VQARRLALAARLEPARLEPARVTEPQAVEPESLRVRAQTPPSAQVRD
jgi:hypothetical protein